MEWVRWRRTGELFDISVSKSNGDPSMSCTMTFVNERYFRTWRTRVERVWQKNKTCRREKKGDELYDFGTRGQTIHQQLQLEEQTDVAQCGKNENLNEI